MRSRKSTTLDASVKVVDGEVVVYWFDEHLTRPSDRSRIRSPLRDKLERMRDYTDLGREYSVTKGKFRFHYRKSTYEANSTGEECYFDGEHLISQEFRSRVCMTRVEL
jgi:hypothetical protein